MTLLSREIRVTVNTEAIIKVWQVVRTNLVCEGNNEGVKALYHYLVHYGITRNFNQIGFYLDGIDPFDGE